MNERERMLAEGPRVAPEPGAAEAGAHVVAAPPRETPRASVDRRWFGRLVPLAAVAAIVALNATGRGGYAFIPIAAIWAVLLIARNRRRRS